MTTKTRRHGLGACAICALTAGTFLLTQSALAADLGGAPRYGGSLKDPPAPAYELTPYRYYLAVRGGVTFPDNTDFNTATLGFSSEYETGYSISGAAGISGLLGVRGLRGEIEIGYNSADVESRNVGTFGRTDVTFGLASVYYDFDTGSFLRPFIGAGVGIADVNFDNHGISGVGVVLDDNSTAFAYHLTGGVNMRLSDSLNLELAYRYFGTAGAELTARDGTRNDIDVSDHQILVGLRQSF